MQELGIKFIYSIFRDGKIYCASIDEIKQHNHQWVQKEGTLVRSFSIQLYKRVNPDPIISYGTENYEKRGVLEQI
jgi:hypothetical protein